MIGKMLTAIALSVVVLASVVLGGTGGDGGGGVDADIATMHNCPRAGEWGIAVWTGEDGTDADVALGTCDTIVAAYTYDYRGDIQRWFLGGSEDVNTIGSFNYHDGVVALGGPAAPSVPEPVNIPIYGTLPDDCRAELLTVAAWSAGQGSRTSFVSRLHDEPFTTIEQTDQGLLFTEIFQQEALIKGFVLLCDDEVLTDADVPVATGGAHVYTISVLITGDEYTILERDHEYMLFDCGRRSDGSIFECRGTKSAQARPPNPTCPVRWELHPDEPPTCPGYPNAIYDAMRCGPNQKPLPGNEWCTFDY